MHIVQKLRVIFNKLHRRFDSFLSLYDTYKHKKLIKNNLDKEKKPVPGRWIEPAIAQISQKQ